MDAQQPLHQPRDQARRPHHSQAMASPLISSNQRVRAGGAVDSWVEVSSQPSSSSLSSVADEIVTTGLRVQNDPRNRRRRIDMQDRTSNVSRVVRPTSHGETSSQEEYDESESESDRMMTSSGEGLALPANRESGFAERTSNFDSDAPQTSEDDDDDDENKTAINYPTNAPPNFTPRPNAFSHPPNTRLRRASQPVVPGSYFPPSRPPVRTARASFPAQHENSRPTHLPQNILSPSYNAAAQHEEALRASLSSLLSVAAAARGLQKNEAKRPTSTAVPARTNRLDPTSFRLVPESALRATSPPQVQEPTFQPTIRRTSIHSASTEAGHAQEVKRKAMAARSSSRERRALKKARRSASSEELFITPTLFTWVVSAGVVVVLSALSFSAGYSMGKEAGRMEAGSLVTDENLRSCAREAGRSSFGLKRSLARTAISV